MANKDNPLSLDDFTKNLRASLDRLETDEEYARSLTAERKGNPITLGPRVISADEWAEKQVSRASSAASEWEKKVLRPRKNPIEAAIKKAEKRRNKVLESLDQGKWEKAMAKVDENLMYAVIRKRGASAYRAGVEDRKDKVAARVKELQPMVAALAANIDAMPDATDADREKRLLAARKGMIEIGKKRRGIS